MYFRGQKRNNFEVFIDDPIDTDKEGNSIRLLDIICSEEDTMETISKLIENEKLRKYILNALTKRERTIIVMRYGLDNKKPKTQREVASIMKISRSYVSRIEKRALIKLKECFQKE